MTEALSQIAKAAVEAERATGCPAELLAAQCLLESGWLQHAPGNNCFGIKWYPEASGRQLLRTKEWFTTAELREFLHRGDGRTAVIAIPRRYSGLRYLYNAQDWFATFVTLGDCFAKRASLYSEGRYARFATEFKASGDLEALVRGIAPIYATDPHYADSVMAEIRSPWLAEALKAARA